MLLQTNSYVVPKEKRTEHARLLRRFRHMLARLGCDQFEVYEQVGANWNASELTGRYVQIMRFRDRKHQVRVQQAERNDPAAQAVIAEFCRLINFPYQQQQGLFAIGYYTSVLPTAQPRAVRNVPAEPPPRAADADMPAHLVAGATTAAAVRDVAPEEPPALPADGLEFLDEPAAEAPEEVPQGRWAEETPVAPPEPESVVAAPPTAYEEPAEVEEVMAPAAPNRASVVDARPFLPPPSFVPPTAETIDPTAADDVATAVADFEPPQEVVVAEADAGEPDLDALMAAAEEAGGVEVIYEELPRLEAVPEVDADTEPAAPTAAPLPGRPPAAPMASAVEEDDADFAGPAVAATTTTAAPEAEDDESLSALDFGPEEDPFDSLVHEPDPAAAVSPPPAAAALPPAGEPAVESAAPSIADPDADLDWDAPANGGGQTKRRSEASISSEVFTDADIDSALAEALRDLDGLDAVTTPGLVGGADLAAPPPGMNHDGFGR